MCPHFDVHTWSCFLLLIFILGNVSLFWYLDLGIKHVFYAHLVMYTFVAILPCVPMLILTLGHVFPCLIFSLGLVSTFCYSHLVTYHCVDINIWSFIVVLSYSLRHVSPSSYWHLVKYPCIWYSHLAMCLHVDIRNCSSIPVMQYSCFHIWPC